MSNGRPRRRSIFSGLLFLVIGSLLLANNFYQDFRLGQLFAQYWPMLLILWGLAKMFDYFASRRTGEAAPPTFSAGEFFLLLFLLAFGAGVTGMRWAADQGEFDFPWSEPWVQRYSFHDELNTPIKKADAQILIANDRGDIKILPEDISEIRVVTEKRVSTSGSESDARQRAANVSVEVREVSGGYEVRAVSRESRSSRIEMDMEIHLPKQANVEVKTQRGDIYVNGLGGNIIASTQRGDIEVREVAKDAELQVRNGDLRVSGVKGNLHITGAGSDIEISDVGGEASIEGEYRGTTRISNVAKGARFLSQRTDLSVGPLPGRLELSIPDLEIVDASGGVSLTTLGKDVRLENVTGKILVQNKSRGDIELRLGSTPKEEVEISSEKGDIHLVLPPNSTFDVIASSRSGEVESEFEGPSLKRTEDEGKGGTARLEGKVGAKGPQIRLNTTYGTVSLRKSGGLEPPTPPQPPQRPEPPRT